MKKFVCFALSFLFITLSLCSGCSSNLNSNSESKDESLRENIPYENLSFNEKNKINNTENHYLEIKNKPGKTSQNEKIEVSENGSFFDDFSSGIDPNIWEIAQKKWGGNNHGVLRMNVGYTSDGQVVLTGNGDLYDGPLNEYADPSMGLRSGACIVTKKQLGPGSFEAKIKALPQMGACTAMWTFFYAGEDRNHEIDIEIPASTSNFKKEQFCTWTSETVYTDKKVTPNFYHNDGKWHIYRFDWHTSPAHVDFYIDNSLVKTIDTDIPDTAGNLWLGVWFPKRWCGTPLFDTSYMLVDYFKYTAFDEPYNLVNKTFPKTPSSAYPKEPIDLPTCNFIANSGFEYDTKTWNYSGNAFISTNPFRNDYLLKIKDSNSFVSQIANSLVPEQEYTLNVTTLGKGHIDIEYYDGAVGTNLISKESLSFDTNAFSQTNKTIKTPKNCEHIKITLNSDDKTTVFFDDIFLVQNSRNDFQIK